LDCTFVSVGHGLAVVLHLPDGRTFLYDCGSVVSPRFAANAVAGYLWERGITHLDAVFLSHADTDHYNGLPDLLDRFSVAAVYVSPVMFRDKSAAIQQLQASIVAHGVPLRETWRGDAMRAGAGCQIDVLHPPRAGLVASDNANCVVLAIEFAGRRLLLTGDLEPPGLEQVTDEAPWACDVLSAPHHGSVRSLPAEILHWCLPSYVAISGGDRENTAKVRAAYSVTGARILNTVVDGAIMAELSAARTVVRTFRNGLIAPPPHGGRPPSS
jgi:competence protein ComEC